MQTQMNYLTIGQRIKKIREKKHLSQMKLAELIDKSTSYISYIETGIKCMSLQTLVQLANSLDVTADEILSDCVKRHESISRSDMSRLMDDCNLFESRVIIDCAKSLKKILRDNNFIKR